MRSQEEGCAKRSKDAKTTANSNGRMPAVSRSQSTGLMVNGGCTSIPMGDHHKGTLSRIEQQCVEHERSYSQYVYHMTWTGLYIGVTIVRNRRRDIFKDIFVYFNYNNNKRYILVRPGTRELKFTKTGRPL